MNNSPIRKSLLILTLLLLLFGFQNCQNFETNNQTDSGSLSQSGEGASSSLPPGTSEEQLRRLQECANLIIKPTINVQSTEVTVLSGLATGAGDQNSTAVPVESNKGISNTSRAQELTCPISTTLRLQLVEGNGSQLNTLTTAKDLSGAEKATGTLTAANIRTLLNNAIQVQTNNQVYEAASNTRSFVIRPNRLNNNMNVLRCVQGQAWFQVNVRTEITGAVTKSLDSDPVFVKVNVQNNCWDETQINPTTTLSRLVQFGAAGAMNSTFLAVAAPKEESATGALEVGSVYIFQKSGSSWAFRQKINLPGAATRDSISAVEFISDRMIIATKYRDNRGAIFVYGLSGGVWAHQATISAPQSQTNQEFGHSLAVNGNFLFVSAPQLGNSGAVFVYELLNGNLNLRQTLTPPVNSFNTAFGFSLSSEGDTLIVGAPQSLLAQAEGSGQVHIFRLSSGSWTQTQVLTPPAATLKIGMRFGLSVSYRGGSLVIGAPHFATGTDDVNRGIAYYYSTLAATPVDLRGSGGEQLFGQTVHLASDRAVFVGAPAINNQAGQVVVYLQSDVSARRISRRLYPLASAAQDNFGSFIVSSGTSLAVGARAKSSPNTGAGAAYVLVRK